MHTEDKRGSLFSRDYFVVLRASINRAMVHDKRLRASTRKELVQLIIASALTTTCFDSKKSLQSIFDSVHLSNSLSKSSARSALVVIENSLKYT